MLDRKRVPTIVEPNNLDYKCFPSVYFHFSNHKIIENLARENGYLASNDYAWNLAENLNVCCITCASGCWWKPSCKLVKCGGER